MNGCLKVYLIDLREWVLCSEWMECFRKTDMPLLSSEGRYEKIWGLCFLLGTFVANCDALCDTLNADGDFKRARFNIRRDQRD